MTDKKIRKMVTEADIEGINRFITNNPYVKGDSEECELLRKVFATIREEDIDTQLVIYTYFICDRSSTKAAERLGITCQYVCMYLRKWLTNVREKLADEWNDYLILTTPDDEPVYTMRGSYETEE